MTKDPEFFAALVGRAIVDNEYWSRLRDPAKQAEALKEIGITKPTAKQLTDLKAAVKAIEQVRLSFGEGYGAA